MTTLVAVAVVWKYLYAPRYGLLNVGLHAIGLSPIDWLGSTAWAMPSIILMTVWKGFGYNMIIFMAGLQAVPGDLYDAARVDGAGAWQRFWHVTLPTLAPDVSVRQRHDNDRLSPAVRRAVRHDAGRTAARDVEPRLYMFQEGFSRGMSGWAPRLRSWCSC